jgi:hypothetical protein
VIDTQLAISICSGADDLGIDNCSAVFATSRDRNAAGLELVHEWRCSIDIISGSELSAVVAPPCVNQTHVLKPDPSERKAVIIREKMEK